MTDILLTDFSLSEEVQLKNRVVMAPLTRRMAEHDAAPDARHVAYYAKRADAGLIVTEATMVSADSKGYPDTPGIYNDQQIEAWRKVVDAVHANEGKIFCQIWHVGRVSHPSYLEGRLPISASATRMSGSIPRLREMQYGDSRAATLAEIQAVVANFRQAALNARAAGFDGVEIHGANGYLIDQFLHYATNLREDCYGASVQDRARFAIEVIESVGEAIGFGRVGLRLSPAGYLNQVAEDSRDADVQRHLLSYLNYLPMAYVHTGNFDDSVAFDSLGGLTMTAFLRQHYDGHLIAAGGYDFDSGRAAIQAGKFDLLALGRAFIANPDLMTRFRHGQAMLDYQASMLEALV